MFDFTPFFENSGEILRGFWATLRLAGAAAVLSLVIGTVMVSFRVAPVPVMRKFGTGYVNIVRNTPLTLVLLMCSLGLNDILALKFSSVSSTTYYWWAVVGLSAYTGAFVCETLRSGINTSPLGQAEAARSIGLTFTQNLRYVVLPQAWKAAIVPLGSVLVAMAKNSALAGFFGLVGDLTNTMNVLVSQEGEPLIPVMIGISAWYLLMTIPASLVLDTVERRRRLA